MKQALIGAMGAVVFVFFVYGMWMLGRYVNYTFGYESLVTATVQEMVKPECLR